ALGDGGRARQGYFEFAEGGVIFLDEIGEMPLSLQAKLLRVLQDHRYERVGGNRSLKSDVRVIAATSRRLEELIEQGRFREDLFYRLNVFPIEVPPLRERRSDVPLLIQEMIARIERENRGSVRLSEKAVAVLQQYDWPGNVRELKNVIERAMILSSSDRIKAEDLALRRTEKIMTGSTPADLNLDDTERLLIQEALARSRDNQSRAAKLLGISRDTLRYRMKKHGLLG
ncbi:MAG: sigma 54-interacting transcriptional regulator, partial [bacterium]